LGEKEREGDDPNASNNVHLLSVEHIYHAGWAVRRPIDELSFLYTGV